jgi:hypothetical protein
MLTHSANGRNQFDSCSLEQKTAILTLLTYSREGQNEKVQTRHRGELIVPR